MLFVWRRPAHTRRVIKRLLELGYTDFLVFSDGPRKAIPEDQALIDSVRKVVSDELVGVSLKTNYASKHLGLRQSMLSGLDWFLSSRPAGLVFEDDNFPSGYLPRFAREGLRRFETDPRVSQINFSSHYPFPVRGSGDSYFSRFHHTWGFGIWRSSWEGFQDFLSARLGTEPSELETMVPGFNRTFYRHWSTRINAEVSGARDTWASSWNFFNFSRGTLALTPENSLVQNIGFGLDATNSRRIPLIAGPPPVIGAPAGTVTIALPSVVTADSSRDKVVGYTQWPTLPLLARIWLAFIEILLRLYRSALVANGSSSKNRTTAAQSYVHRRFGR